MAGQTLHRCASFTAETMLKAAWPQSGHSHWLGSSCSRSMPGKTDPCRRRLHNPHPPHPPPSQHPPPHSSVHFNCGLRKWSIRSCLLIIISESSTHEGFALFVCFFVFFIYSNLMYKWFKPFVVNSKRSMLSPKVSSHNFFASYTFFLTWRRCKTQSIRDLLFLFVTEEGLCILCVYCMCVQLPVTVCMCTARGKLSKRSRLPIYKINSNKQIKEAWLLLI